MSWAGEEWKDGLNHRALAKINEIEQQNEKLRKETKQKQYQIESLDAAFGKQVTYKYGAAKVSVS